MRWLFLISMPFFLVGVALPFEKYVLTCRKELIIESRILLFNEIGIRELSNRNDGKEIEKYQKEVGLPKGSPYCVAGQYYCFAEASRKLGMKTESVPLCRTGLSGRLYNCAKSKGRAVFFRPALDDIIVWARNYPFGHVERIVAVFRRGWVETVGFNTKRYNPASKKFEEGVFRWRRNFYNRISNLRILGFIGFRAS